MPGILPRDDSEEFEAARRTFDREVREIKAEFGKSTDPERRAEALARLEAAANAWGETMEILSQRI